METQGFNLFRWNEAEYSVNDAYCDEEHRRILSFFRKCVRTLSADTKDLPELLSTVGFFIRTHFQNEEHFLRSVDWPEAKAHTEAHRVILSRLDEVHAIAPSDAAVKALFEFFDEALLHLTQEDGKYGRYLSDLTLDQPAAPLA